MSFSTEAGATLTLMWEPLEGREERVENWLELTPPLREWLLPKPNAWKDRIEECLLDDCGDGGGMV